MALTENPLVTLIEESIRLKDSAQFILSEAVGGTALTRIERLVLIMITESEQPMTASQISRHLGHPRQVIQRCVNRLLELKLLQKLDNPDHRTSPLIQATKKGVEFENQLGDKLLEIVDSLLDKDDINMCLRISKDLKKLRALLESYQSRTSSLQSRQKA